MPARFHRTSTNRIIQLAGEMITSFRAPEKSAEQLHTGVEEYQYLLDIDVQLQDLIQRFNLGVEASFKAGGMHVLKACVTEAGYARMQEKYTNWRSQKVQALNLVSCDFLSFKILPEDANRIQLFTFEKWVFVYEDGSEHPTRGAVDGYDVHLVDGQWRIDSVTFFASNPEPR